MGASSLRSISASWSAAWPSRSSASPLEGFDGVLVFGGATNSDEEQPWLTGVRDLVGRVLERGLPCIGVCLGGQLLAQASGGEASTETHPGEIGWRQLEVADEVAHDPFFVGFRDGEWVYQFHTYGITAPPDATVLAATRGDHQLVRVGEAAWGRHVHLEVDMPTLAIKLVSNLDEIEAASIDAKTLREESVGHLDRLGQLGEQVAYRFLAFCTKDTTKGSA